MKKQIIIIMLAIFIIAFITAGDMLPSWDRDIDIDDEKLDTLKRTLDIDKIAPVTSEIICNELECYAKIKQEGVINTEFRTSKNYCSKYTKCPEGDNEELDCEPECLEYTDWTPEELKDKLDDYIKIRLEEFADAQKMREDKGLEESIAGGGTVNVK